MKKLFLLVMSVLCVGTLFGCGGNETPPAAVDYGQEFINTLTISSSATTSLALKASDQEGLVVSYTSSNTDVIAISGTTATITQQKDDTTVTVTASAKYADFDTVTKNFSVKVIGNGLSPDGIYTIAEMNNLPDATPVKVKSLTVTAVTANGLYATDNTDIVFVYYGKGEVGKTYDIEGTKSSYSSLNQIQKAELTEVTTVTSTYKATNKTINQIVNSAEAHASMGYFNVTATITEDGGTYYFTSGSDKVVLSSYSTNENKGYLAACVGEELTLNIYVNGKAWNGWTAFYTEGVDGLGLSTEDKVRLDASNLTLSSTYLDDITLVDTGLFGSAITWSSSKTDVVSNEGVVTRPATGDVEVVLTATTTLNDKTSTKSITIKVRGLDYVAQAELFISEYYEGKSNDKYIEIYNPGTEAVDLSAYSVKTGVNGAAFSSTYNFEGTLGAGECIILYNSQTNASANMDSHNAFTWSAATWNGDDAIGLFKEDVLIDIIGVEGTDPGASWPVLDGTTLDHRLIRAKGVTGNTTFTESEWIVEAVGATGDLFDNIGIHDFI